MLTKIDIRYACFSVSLISALGLGYSVSAHAALLDLADTPLFITKAAKSNVLLLLDNSGSMNWEPDDATFGGGDQPDSKSEIARQAALSLIDGFGDRFNLGLMSYHQLNVTLYPQCGGGWGGGCTYPNYSKYGEIRETHWAAGAGNGGGMLNVPVRETDSSHISDMQSYLATERYDTSAEPPLRNAGGTPIEGSLLSALDYYQGDLANANGGDKIVVDSNGDHLPQSCGSNSVILITDGLPTIDKDGNGVESAEAIPDSAAAAAKLKTDEDIDTFVIGFALGGGAGDLDSIASAGGTTQAHDANDRKTISGALTNILYSIEDVESSRASVSSNGGMLSTDSLVFQATFDAGDWAGSLKAFPITSGNQLSSTPNWNAAEQYGSGDWTVGRQILTWNGSAGVAFQTGNMTTEMKTWLNIDPYGEQTGVNGDSLWEERVGYFRGERASAFTDAYFRTRESPLGDIVHSAPVYVGAPSFSYPDDFESKPYSSFKSTYQNRTPAIYVGANDGMLHAFDGSSEAEEYGVKKGGTELFSYVPFKAYRHLSNISSEVYSYHPSVDGQVTVGDAYINNQWKTVLVGGLRGGGQGYFALDVTDPDDVTESNAASKVLWEFSDLDNKHLGYSYSSAAIAKMPNGKWVAIFGSGYNNSEDDNEANQVSDGVAESNNGKAALYIVNLATGNLMKRIQLPGGNAATPNGLSTPAPVDSDGDNIVDTIFAGDLRGALWRFDVSSSDKADWNSAYMNGSTKVPLFIAKDGSGNRQPITTRPEVVRNPETNDLLVLFGTGKYLEKADLTLANIGDHTFYGVNVEDGLTSALQRNKLVEQEILSQVIENPGTSSETGYRLISNNTIDWTGTKKGWFIDLPNDGEMVISNPLARNDQIVFSTAEPATDACQVGGNGWFMELNFLDGGRSAESVVDVNEDGLIDEDDLKEFTVGGSTETGAVNGMRRLDGFLATPLVLTPESIDADNPVEYKFITGTSGGVSRVVEKTAVSSSGRRSWRQIH